MYAKAELTPCTQYWVNKFGEKINCPEAWLRSKNTTKEVRLIMMQWKILHNIYPSNSVLYKINITDTNVCDHCGLHDTVEHYFYSCTANNELWHAVTSDINAICMFPETTHAVSNTP